MSVLEDLAALRVHGDTMVFPGDADHAVNVLAGGPPAWLTRALGDADVTRYPDPRAATDAVAAMHGREPAEVVITNGAAEALWLLGPALNPQSAELIQPGFTETEAGLRAHGIAITRSWWPSARVQHPDDNSVAHGPVDNQTVGSLLLATNPTSPDGVLRQREQLLARRAPGRTLVIDEAFMSLVPGEPESLARTAMEDVIVVRSLTKLLSVPGLRVGYALAPPPLAERLRAAQPPWSANALALAVLTAAAAHPAELAALARRAAAEREDLIRRLSALPQLTVRPSVTNFVLIEVPDGPALVAALRARQIAVRPAASFPGFGPNHIRVTARDPEANGRLAAAIEAAL